MDALTAFGLFAVTMMLFCYALEERSPWFILAFAIACALGSIYGFLQGAWPFGLVEARSGRSSRCGAGSAGGASIVTDGRTRLRSLFLRRPRLRSA
jgi:hypothetical protein